MSLITITMFGKKTKEEKRKEMKLGGKGREEKEKLFPFVWFVRGKRKEKNKLVGLALNISRSSHFYPFGIQEERK